jgi:hypothetical protein
MSLKLYYFRLPLILLLIVAFLALFSSELINLMAAMGFNVNFLEQLQIILKLMAWTIAFASLAIVLNRYLRSGFNSSSDVYFSNNSVMTSSSDHIFNNEYVDNKQLKN